MEFLEKVVQLLPMFHTCWHLRLQTWSRTVGSNFSLKQSAPETTCGTFLKVLDEWGGGGKGDVSPLELVEDQNGARLIMTYGEVTFKCVCEEGSQFREWPDGLKVK